MDEKTAELRDIFIDTTGSDTVTESQEEGRGSLSGDKESQANERLAEIIATMRGKYGFTSTLEDAQLQEVVERYYKNESDADIATAIGVDSTDVFAARMDLHLVRDEDRDAPFDLTELRALLVEETPFEEQVTALDATETDVRHYTEVVEADLESTRANDRFRDEFTELLTDSELSGQFARDAREDGLRDATEDIETDVSF